MEYEYSYANSTERAEKTAEAQGLGYEMIHDNFDPDWQSGDEPHGVLIFIDPIPKTDEELYQGQLAQEFNDIHEKAILALQNWGSLTLAQKDTILKNLLKWALWKDGWLKLGVL
jgi:hypothetical protein